MDPDVTFLRLVRRVVIPAVCWIDAAGLVKHVHIGQRSAHEEETLFREQLVNDGWWQMQIFPEPRKSNESTKVSFGVRIMVALATVADVLWYPHHFLDGTRFLGRRGVFYQQEHHDCGCAALKMILDHFGVEIDYCRLRQRLSCGPEGTTMLSIKRSAEAAGLSCEGWRLTVHDLPGIPLPAVLLLHRKHFAVMTSFQLPDSITILDPVRGRLKIGARRLASLWNGETLLFCKPAPATGTFPWFA